MQSIKANIKNKIIIMSIYISFITKIIIIIVYIYIYIFLS